jgi:hypothetical protein
MQALNSPHADLEFGSVGMGPHEKMMSKCKLDSCIVRLNNDAED